jgi:hypothetical protein
LFFSVLADAEWKRERDMETKGAYTTLVPSTCRTLTSSLPASPPCKRARFQNYYPARVSTTSRTSDGNTGTHSKKQTFEKERERFLEEKRKFFETFDEFVLIDERVEEVPISNSGSADHLFFQELEKPAELVPFFEQLPGNN